MYIYNYLHIEFRNASPLFLYICTRVLQQTFARKEKFIHFFEKSHEIHIRQTQETLLSSYINVCNHNQSSIPNLQIPNVS